MRFAIVLKALGWFFILALIFGGFARADCDSCPSGVSLEKIISRFTETLQSKSENVVLVRKLTGADIDRLKFDEFFIDEKVLKIADSGKAIQIFEVLDKVKDAPKYLAYAAKLEVVTPNEWNRGLTHLHAPEGTEWLLIVNPSPVSSEEIGGIKFIELPDEAAGVISAASESKLGFNVKAFLSDLKILSGGAKLSGEELTGLKTGIGKAIYKQLPAASH